MTDRTRNWILLMGDAAMLYASLALMIAIRGGVCSIGEFWSVYFTPFTVLHAIWLTIFYVTDLYSPRHRRVTSATAAALGLAMAANALIGIIFFYFMPIFAIAPKTNLALHIAISAVLVLGWRAAISSFWTSTMLREPVVFVDPDAASLGLIDSLKADACSPFTVAEVLAVEHAGHIDLVVQAAAAHRAGTIVIGNSTYNLLEPAVFSLMLSGVSVRDAASFWEELLGEVPLASADSAWFLAGFASSRRVAYDAVKRLMDLAIATTFIFLFWWLFLLVAILVRLSGHGPVLFRQERVGRYGKTFTICKFRTMVPDAERAGPQWSPANDPRVTRLGRFLRHTHLDEMPQLRNILSGEMSFVGPRPERPEFVVELEKLIPYYSLRHLVKPGITGWAQVRYRYGASADDARRKLAFDLYYVKQRSLFLDFQIALKTLAMFFRGEGRGML